MYKQTDHSDQNETRHFLQKQQRRDAGPLELRARQHCDNMGSRRLVFMTDDAKFTISRETRRQVCEVNAEITNFRELEEITM